jgi:hypothetical protein
MPITKASEWKAKTLRPIELELPSGLTVMVRKLPLHLWISAGKLPENLVSTMLNAQSQLPGVPQAAPRMDSEQFKNMFRFMRDVILATVVEPRIVDQATSDDEISPDDIPLDDANFIFQWAMAGGAVPSEQKAAARSGWAAQEGQVQVDVTDLEHFRSF